MQAKRQVISASNPERHIPFARVLIDDDDIAAVVETLQSGWITTGPKVRQFEAAFALRMGVNHAVALNSATAALHLGLEAAGLEPGDEVIVPTLTFTACAEVVRYFDATPILVDVRTDSLCIDPDRARRAITPRTRAVIPVHFGGQAADMDAIMSLAGEYGLSVIEDAAHALPCTYGGREAGTIGHVGAFSFYATKPVTTGEGGMLVTDSEEIAERVRLMSLHGMSRDAWKRYARGGSWRYDVVAPGYKYNMTDMAAALGISQLRKADAFWERRVWIANRYTEVLSAYPQVQTPSEIPGTVHAWHLYVLRLNLDRMHITRDAFLEELAQRGVQTSVHFIPLHMLSYYRSVYAYQSCQFPVASREYERMFSLPIYPSMTDTDVDFVLDRVVDLITEYAS